MPIHDEKPDQAPEVGMEESPIHPLGLRLKGQYELFQSQRREVEDGWIEDVRQYAGEYNTAKVKIKKGASKAFVKFTRTKVKALDARMGELVEPASRIIWSILPSPVPEIPEERREMLKSLIIAKGVAPEEVQYSHIERLESLLAEGAAKKMQLVMKDQMAEGGFSEVGREVRHNGHKLGIGILKGPLIETTQKKRWVRGENEEYRVEEVEERRPYFESVRPFDLFFDLTSGSFKRCDAMHQRHVRSRWELRKLGKRADFDSDAIEAHIATFKDGDSEWASYDRQLLGIGRDDPSALGDSPKKKFEVVEFWGMLDGRELSEMGVEVEVGLMDHDFEANVWYFAKTGRVIKAVLNPTEKKTRPYSFYIPEAEEGKLTGYSQAYILRDSQQLMNAAIRMLVDNGATAVEPQWVMNTRFMKTEQQTTKAGPGKIWYANMPEGATGSPLTAIKAPLHTGTYISMYQVFKSMGDEAISLPSFQHGEKGPGIGRTVGGLSMLMSTANVMLKEPLKAWDTCLEEAIGRLYDWNMQFNPRTDIKGDFAAIVEGSYSVMNKELRADKIAQFLDKTNNPTDLPYVERREMLLEYTEAVDLPSKLIKTEERLSAEAAAQQQAAQGQPPALPGAPSPGGGGGNGTTLNLNEGAGAQGNPGVQGSPPVPEDEAGAAQN